MTYARDHQGGAGVIGEIRVLLARNLSGYEVRSLTVLGEGLDKLAYEIQSELVVRANRRVDPAKRGQSHPYRTRGTRTRAALSASGP